MPTGYTADIIEKDIPFREFALKCMRAFGALISYRDDDINKVVTEIPLSTYHGERLIEAKKELDSFNAKTDEERQAMAQGAITQDAQRSRESYAKAAEENARLLQMRAQVAKWEPPTPEHVQFREFMLQQLQISLNDLSFYVPKLADLSDSAVKVWIIGHRQQLEDSVKYHDKHMAEDVRKNRQANEWIKAIVSALPEY